MIYDVAISARYHRKRQRFLDLIDKITKAATVLLSASLFGAMLKEGAPVVAGVISSLGLLSLVFAYGDRKQAHKELAEAFMNFRSRMERSAVSELSDELCRQWASEFHILNAKEPPQLKTLVLVCEYEEHVAQGHHNLVTQPNWCKRQIAHFGI